ncbi:hypothetical protein SPFM15_00062 [Salmonella phage SPFM15]|nr:hypothetical protein SPFM5_00057 [Salmonella phage SPFM5]VFR13686.1 hypothetical protein SPFM15_00062 [Salmonella phage SPFM15]
MLPDLCFEGFILFRTDLEFTDSKRLHWLPESKQKIKSKQYPLPLREWVYETD